MNDCVSGWWVNELIGARKYWCICECLFTDVSGLIPFPGSSFSCNDSPIIITSNMNIIF